MKIRLTYASLLAPGCGEDCIEDIVSRSAPANRERGITGILAVEKERVLQILEGEEAAVVSLFEHIRKDDRHLGVVELDRTPIAEPHFADWGMARRAMADAVMLSQTL